MIQIFNQQNVDIQYEALIVKIIFINACIRNIQKKFLDLILVGEYFVLVLTYLNLCLLTILSFI